jgi:hypothetical protein
MRKSMQAIPGYVPGRCRGGLMHGNVTTALPEDLK